MTEYSYNDFISALDDTGRAAVEAVAERIQAVAPLFMPCGVRYSKPKDEWEMFFRKKGKPGKSACALFISGGKLSLRLSFLTTAVNEFLLRQQEFFAPTRRAVLGQSVCVSHSKCRGYGGNNPCEWRQRFLIDGRLITTCPYPWITLDYFGDDALPDVLKLIDLQIRHMAQDSKDIKGNGYAEESRLRCGDVFTVSLVNTRMNVDDFSARDFVIKPERLEKYAALYSLIPMGESAGLWFYRSDAALKGDDAQNLSYSASELPAGQFCAVDISNPISFSVQRAWNYICDYLLQNGLRPKALPLESGEASACFTRFYLQNGAERMTVYVHAAVAKTALG